MSLHPAPERLTAYVQERLSGAESADLRGHLLKCEDCYGEYEYQARLASPLRELPRVEAPAAVATALRVGVSAQAHNRFWERWQVHLENLMRPVALPAAGGLLAALILFGVLIPGVSVLRVAAVDDVPTVLMTEPHIKDVSPFPVHEDLLVEAWVDQQGKISHFEVLHRGAADPAAERELRYQLSNVLLTTFFVPATEFGQPTAGKVVLSFRRLSQITIRG